MDPAPAQLRPAARLVSPGAELTVLRAYIRQRAMLIEHRAVHIQHMQKALQQMNLQLPQVVTDITGLTGMQIMRAIIAGERDPVVLTQFRHPRCQSTARRRLPKRSAGSIGPSTCLRSVRR